MMKTHKINWPTDLPSSTTCRQAITSLKVGCTGVTITKIYIYRGLPKSIFLAILCGLFGMDNSLYIIFIYMNIYDTNPTKAIVYGSEIQRAPVEVGRCW